MGKYRFGIGAQAAEAELGFNRVKPPKGVYPLVIKQCKIKKNKNQEDMLNLLLEISGAKGSKAKANGYGIWQNFNVTDQAAPYINEFLDAFGIPRLSLWDGELTIDSATPPNLLKIGRKKVVGLRGMAVTDDDKDLQGREVLRATVFLKPGDEAAEDDDDVEETDEDEAVGLEDAEDEETDEDEEASDEEADEDEADSEVYTEDELKELSAADLKGILDEWEVEYAARATPATLRKLILQAQEAEEEEPAEDEPEEDEDEEAEEGAEGFTQDELAELDPVDLKAIINENGWDMPRPPVKRNLIKAILEAQSEPPF